MVERFFKSLKTEKTRYVPYPNPAQGKADITEYIAIFYNHYRLHSSADNLPPAEYEANLEKVAK
ncbi:MAG: IS3 family transposase [bacterium]